ncbi:ligand-binding protein SH3 [Candidatus Pacearchaeota archaeon]|nr:ligand-binding protein SH3 [Candidatus Pacearchaeota archaeon]
MMQLIYALLLTIAPVTELRIGLPVAIDFALKNSVPISLVFFLIVILNILMIFVIFFFLDYLHEAFMNITPYKKMFNHYIKRFQKKVDKFERKYEEGGFLALVLFVAVPLPGTGAWSGCLVSWLLGLERKQSILAISLGVLIAGILVLLGTLGTLNFINFFF